MIKFILDRIIYPIFVGIIILVHLVVAYEFMCVLFYITG